MAEPENALILLISLISLNATASRRGKFLIASIFFSSQTPRAVVSVIVQRFENWFLQTVIRTRSITAEIRGKKYCIVEKKADFYLFTVKQERLCNMLQDLH